MIRGIRGATTLPQDTAQEVIKATQELLVKMIEANNVELDDIVCIIFTGTPDITSEFPAKAARLMGWEHVPLMGSQELNVKNSLPLCIRILMLVNTDKTQQEINHIYLAGAKNLRSEPVVQV